MYIDNINDDEIINKVLTELNIKYVDHKYFNDGASSRVILLNNKYIIKQNEKEVLQSEIEFLQNINSNFFQQILYIDPNFDFVVYNFINGNTIKKINNPKEYFNILVKAVSKYTTYTKNGYGYLDNIVPSWSQFLINEINYSSENIIKYFPNNLEIFKYIEILEKYTFDKKLLHGDFGTHNFIENNNNLVGIIDPMGVIGDPLYDILFAFVSNIDFIQNISINELYNYINQPIEKINAMLKIVTYCRISRCIKHHPHNLEVYLSFFDLLPNIG